MSEIMVRERFLRSGKKVYEYSFEMASVDGKRKRKSKSGFVERFLELSLFYGLSSPLNSEMICIFPYF